MAQFRRPMRRTEGLKKDLVIDFKNIELLERFVDDDGRLRSRRRTRAASGQQHEITRAVKLARFMALLPYTSSHVRDSGAPIRERYERYDRYDRGDRGDRYEREDRGDRGSRAEAAAPGSVGEEIAEGPAAADLNDVAAAAPNAVLADADIATSDAGIVDEA